ncbi:hypothetical protein [Mobilicoccus massiliensis]|uniref:hypothetical protein n=1 Tax=Mobilicoccus massiliensis TaxID=1522310 RepID=UPI00058D79DF|nr:hypothetical protein [Mobilicoccus massiliensis]
MSPARSSAAAQAAPATSSTAQATGALETGVSAGTATAPATTPRPTGSTITTPATWTPPHAEIEQKGGNTRAARRRARAESLVSSMTRLALGCVLACSLNGAAAYALVQSDAPRVQAVAEAQTQDLDGAAQSISSMSATAPRLPVGAAGEQGYLKSIEAGASGIASATARAASGPRQFTGDVDRLTDLSAAYAAYVAALEEARSTTGSAAAGRFSAAESIRTQRIAPVLTELGTKNAERSDGAEVSSVLSIGFLSVTSLATLVALLGASRWLAVRTKRIVNPGLTGALVLSGAVSGYAFSGLSAQGLATSGSGPLLLVGGLAAAGLAWMGVDERRKEYR